MTMKNKQVNVPSITVDKNIIIYENSFICTDNISLITVSPIPQNTSWIFAIILALASISIIKIVPFCIFTLIVAILWFIIVVVQNSNRGENLAISLNSGTTLYFNCKSRDFLNKVVFTMIDSIKNKNQSKYSVNFDKCTIYGGVLKESVVGK